MRLPREEILGQALFCFQESAMPFGTPGAFPLNSAIGWGPTHYRHQEPDVAAVTVTNRFDDGGYSAFTTNTAAPESWHMIWEGLTNAEADVITAHYRNAWSVYSFNFVDKLGATQAGVRYAEQGGYSRTHNSNRSWTQRVEVLLVKYP